MANAKQNVDAMQDLRKLDKEQLLKKIADLRKELVEQQRANRAGELPSTAVIAKIRKNIARGLTVLSEKAQAPEQAQKEQEK